MILECNFLLFSMVAALVGLLAHSKQKDGLLSVTQSYTYSISTHASPRLVHMQLMCMAFLFLDVSPLILGFFGRKQPRKEKDRDLDFLFNVWESGVDRLALCNFGFEFQPFGFSAEGKRDRMSVCECQL